MLSNQPNIKVIERNADIAGMLSNRESAAQACVLLKALANEDRLLILCQLVQGKKNVGELEHALGIHQPTLSQQLTVLREEKLVNTERKGKYIYYSLASNEALQIMLTLYDLFCAEKNSARQSDHPVPKQPILSRGE